MRRSLAALQRHRDAALAAHGHDDRVHPSHHQRSLLLLCGRLAGVDFAGTVRGHLARAAAVATVAFTLVEAILGALLVKLGLDRAEPFAVPRALSCSAPGQYPAVARSAHTHRAFAQPRTRLLPRQTSGLSLHSAQRWASLVLLVGRRHRIRSQRWVTRFSRPTSLGSALAQDFAARSGWLVRWRWTHPTFAFLASIFLIWLLVRAAQRSAHWDNRALSALVLILLAAQYILGVLDVVLLAPVWLQIAHLLGADALWAALVVLTARLTLQPKEQGSEVGTQRSVA